jgi:hypothetical protein
MLKMAIGLMDSSIEVYAQDTFMDGLMMAWRYREKLVREKKRMFVLVLYK